MKTIKELKELAQSQSSTEDLSSLEKSVIHYINGEDSYLKEELQNLESSEALFIIRSLVGSESISADLDLNSLDYSFDYQEINSLTQNLKISIELNKEDFNLLLSKNISVLPVKLESLNGHLGLVSKKKESQMDGLSSRMSSLMKKSSPKIVSMRNNLVMASVMMLGTSMFSSCGAVDGIAAKTNYQTRPPITMPAIGGEQITGDFELNFANHAVHLNEEDQLTSYKMSEEMLIEVPKTIKQINYQSSSNKPTLTLTANGQYVCSYIWVGQGQSNPNSLDESVATVGEYRMHKSCFQEMETSNGMVIKVENLPKSKTITMKFNFEK